MYIALRTKTVWSIEAEEDFSYRKFFCFLPMLLTSGTEIIMLGAYEPPEKAKNWLEEHSIELKKHLQEFFDGNFSLNRREYPEGRAFAIPATTDNCLALAELCQTGGDGGNYRGLYFDHIAAFRPGDPWLPLINFHDATTGGALELSGLYGEGQVKAYAKEGLRQKKKKAPK